MPIYESTAHMRREIMIEDFRSSDAPAERIRRRRGRPASKGEHALSEEWVLEVAFSAFAERGYEGTTLRALAKTLGVSHNLLNVRFGTKADLWRYAVDARVAQRSPPVYDVLDAVELDDETRLCAFVKELCRWSAYNADFVALMNTEGRRATWRNEHIVDRYLKPVKERLDALLMQVAGRRAVAPISTVAFMSMIVHGVGFFLASGPTLRRLGVIEEIAPANVDVQADRIAQLILNGLLPDRSPND